MKALRGVVVVVAVLLVAGSALASPQDMNQLLKGDYAFSGETTCLVSEGLAGFSANHEPLGPARTVSFSSRGVRSFDGNGKGFFQGRTVAVVHSGRVGPPTPPPSGLRSAFAMPFLSASSSDFEAKFSYTVAPDGRTFTAELDEPFKFTFTSGVRNGQTGTSDALPGEPIRPFSGFISHDHKTLVSSSDGPSVEVVHFDGPPPPGPGPADEQRICHRSNTSIKIK